MYSIIENVINSGRFDLSSMLKKIDTLWVQGDLTDDDRDTLIQKAQSNANPENSYAPLQDQINEIFNKIEVLEETINANAKGVLALKTAVESLGTSVTEPEPDPVDEWPAYTQPTGAHNAYNIGDKITYNGDHYICKMNGCVWSPIEYPQGWEKQV